MNQRKCVIDIDIANPLAVDQKKSVQVSVNPKKAYTFLPRKKLEKLGLKPIGKGNFTGSRGEVIQRDIGSVLIDYQGFETLVMVAFIEFGVREYPTLGASAMAALGLEFDAVSNELKHVIPVIPLITEGIAQ